MPLKEMVHAAMPFSCVDFSAGRQSVFNISLCFPNRFRHRQTLCGIGRDGR